MTIRDMQGKTEDRIQVRTVVVSVHDKAGLDLLIPGILEASPWAFFLSTGGTYARLQEILGKHADAHLTEVGIYTGFPEMEGGLVKTLHPKVFAGILGERNNLRHQQYLNSLDRARYIDMMVVNLYPFADMVKQVREGRMNPKTGHPFDFESARGNIDIGGHAMLRAAAKNFPGCAAVCDPRQYPDVLAMLRGNGGRTSWEQRLRLAGKAFQVIGQYDAAISAYMAEQARSPAAARACYTFSGG